MKTPLIIVLLFLLAASSFGVELGPSLNSVRILSVSTQVDVENANRNGSSGGGTRLFIKVVGHDPFIASNNQVLVGPYQCVIPDMGVNEIFITCITTPATDQTKTYYLPVIVRTVDRSDSQCAATDQLLCTFNYTYDSTPLIQYILPRASATSARLDWIGSWRISNTNQINKMMIGNQICDRFFLGLNEDEAFKGQNTNPLKCDVGSQMTGGYYSASFLSLPGTSIKESRVTTVRSKTLDTPYDIQVVPIIDSISHTKATTQGAIINIKAKGLPTDITKVTVDLSGIPCTVLSVDAVNNKLSCKLPAGISPPAGTSFSSSSGVRLQKMATKMWSLDDAIADYRLPSATRINIPISDQIIAGSEFIDNTYKNDKGVTNPRLSYVMTGFFTPPRDGAYNFQLTTNYKARLYFQTTGSSTTIDTMTNIAEILEGTALREPYSGRFSTQTPISASQNLLQSQSYYFELFAIASQIDMSYANLGVRIPTGDTKSYNNSAGQVTRVQIVYPFTQEVITVTHNDLSATAPGTFQIHFIQPFGTQLQSSATYWETPSNQFDKNSSCSYMSSHFQSHLQYVHSTCVVNVTPTGATWTLTFSEHRLQISPTFVYDSTLSVAPSFAQITPAGPDLGGVFRMLCNGVYLIIDKTTSIPIDVPEWKIGGALQTLLGTSNISVTRSGNFVDGPTYFINMYDLAASVSITAESASLIGAGVSIAIDDLLTPTGSTLIYGCIENDLLSQQTSSPAIVLRVNDVQAICNLANNCSVAIDDATAPSFTGFSDDETLKQVTITGLTASPGSTGLTETSFTVLYNNEILQSISYTAATSILIAQYKVKIAGSYKPIVDQVGFGAALSSSVLPVLVNPLIVSLSKPTIFSFGGSELVITGKYFPAAIDALLTVTIDGVLAKITAVSNTSISIITPVISTLGAKNIVVTYASFASANFSITVDNAGAITITGLSHTVVSPVEKSKMTVTGTNFGTDSKVLTGYLDKLDSSFALVEYAKYQVNVVAAFGTSVTVLLGGGQSGTYRLRIVKKGFGSNDPNTTLDRFEYNIYITSFSRADSSMYGGTKLVIFGKNFSLIPLDNQVLVPYSAVDSEFCIISSVTVTEIHCTLPDMSAHFTTPTTPTQIFQIEVWGKLIAQAIVSPSSPGFQSQITFSAALAPVVTGLNYNWLVATHWLTINGVGLPLDITTFSVIAIGYENLPATIMSSTGTAVQVLIPLLPYGRDMKLVVCTANGYSASQLINVVTDISSFALYSAVSSGGQEFDFPMAGLIPKQEPIFRFNLIQATVLSFVPATGVARVRLPPTTAGAAINLEFAKSASLPLNSDGTYAWELHGTTFTVVTALWSVTAIPVISGQTVTITGTGLTNLKSAYLQQVGAPKSTQYANSIAITATATSATITFGTAPAGSYTLFLLDAAKGYPIITSPTFQAVKIDLPATLTVSSPLTSSFAGGFAFTITGTNFNPNEISKNEVIICGSLATVVSATSTQLNLLTPPAYTVSSLTKYGFSQNTLNKITEYTTFGDDSTGNPEAVGDGDLLFYYSSSNLASCFVGLQFDSATLVMLSRFELYPRSWGVTDASVFFGSIFQASVDNVTWVNILTIGTDFHLGKNLYIISSLLSTGSNINISNPYRYFRLSDPTGASKCQLVEIKLFGWKTSTAVEAAGVLTCPLSVMVNGSTMKSLTNSVTYQDSLSYTVLSVTPNYGDLNGGTLITVTLDKAPTGIVDILIDKQACLNVAIAGLTVTCTTAKKSTKGSPSLAVQVQGQLAVNNDILFYYGNLWSLDATWGGDFAPIDGDVVSVLAGNVLIVDVPYVGVLNTVVIDSATLIFANNLDIHFEAQNIIVKDGRVIIGTQSAPILNKVRITMHGKMTDKQFPTVGNKGLSIHSGSLDIQGKPRVVTWTELSATAEKNVTQIDVFLKDVAGFDWAVGEEIVIASTDFSHVHAERRIIKTITKSATTATITFDAPLTSRHVSIVETYNGVAVAMRAEVGLLTRNVVFEGDQSSHAERYGAHIMLHGESASARIRHAEFRYTGQPQIIGRYPIHFHMVGDVSGSIVEGNAVHDSFARVLTIHATHYLRVKNNVGFNCSGHNIFLEDGIETNNIIEENLMLSTKQVWSMLQSDITAASYWITNPLNTVINNRAAGGDFYGFWYEIKPNPDGPSARSDICPQGMALGKFDGNKAHSYDRFGLRIFVMTNLLKPCSPHRNDSVDNPFIDNPSFLTTWSNFVSFRNYEDGVLAEEVGNMLFDNFYLIDNKQSGFNTHLTNRTDEEVVLRNSIIVGKSAGNAPTDAELDMTRGIITPRTDGFRVENVHFENFSGTMTVLKSISVGWHHKSWVTGGKLTRFKGITFTNVLSNMMFWENWRREIYEDIDGSLTGRNVPSWITPNAVHISGLPACTTTAAESLLWDDGLICSKQLVRIEFSNPIYPGGVPAVAIFSQLADSQGVTLGGTDPTKYYISKSVLIMNHAHDLEGGFAGVFLAGQTYSVQWELSNMDFTHMSVQLSPFHRGSTPADTIVLKFPWVDHRDSYQVGMMIARVNSKFYLGLASSTPLTSLTCSHGDWFNSKADAALYLCLNQNGRTSGSTNQLLDRTDLNAVVCTTTCPVPSTTCVLDGINRLISDPTTWADQAGATGVINPTGAKILNVPCTWTIIVDADLLIFDQIIVEGVLRIDPTKSVNISAFGIWIKGGTIIAEGATPGTPYTNNLSFKLLGDGKTKTQFIIDNNIDVGSKVIANTGTFTLIGNPPTTTSSRLLSPLEIGSTTITVESAAGWAVGDLISIAPTQLGLTEDEEFKITAIAANVITLSAPSLYYHYGAPLLTITETWGTYTQELDLRAQVLHLSRNIKIWGEGVADPTVPWGCRVLTYYFMKVADSTGALLPVSKQFHNRGTIDWTGVEMSNCGQPSTTRGAIDFTKSPTNSEKKMSYVKKSAIHHCPGYCANIDSSADITFDENNFYKGRPILMRIWTAKNIVITNNHFVGALQRNYIYSNVGMVFDMNAHIYFYSEQSIVADQILVAHNYMQGSEGVCLVVPHTDCATVASYSSTVGIFANQVQTCMVGAMYQQISTGCQWAGKVSVSRSIKGLMINPNRPGIVIENVIAAESDRGLLLRFANEGVNNSGILKDSSIYGVAIANDLTAYDTTEKAAVCTNTAGTQNLVVTRGGESFPLKNNPLVFDVVCNSEAFDAQLYQVNVKYTRIRKTYLTPGLTKCSNNFMMATHPIASDATAGTYNTGVTCVDCDVEAYFNFRSASPAWAGWFGGCGLFLCTGPENVLNVDQTGSLFANVPTSAISHNIGIINPKCKLQANWNGGYQCDGLDYIQLEWESNAPDFNKRSSAPVILTSASGYTNNINMYREWAWSANEPLNLRENRFVATALVNTVYKISYNGLNPYNLMHRIQPRTLNSLGEPTVWVIFDSTYQIPMNIEVSVDGVGIVESFLVNDKIDLTTKTAICGANIYDYNTRNIQFVINGKPDCIVRVVVLDTVRLNVKVNIPVGEFFANNNKFSFISAVASFLGIKDYSRIKVVGAVPNPARFLQTTPVPAAPSSFTLIFDITNVAAPNTTPTPQSVYDLLNGYATTLSAGFTANTVTGLAPNVYQFTSSTTSVSIDTNGGIFGGGSTPTIPTGPGTGKGTGTGTGTGTGAGAGSGTGASSSSSSPSSSSSSILPIILGIVIGLVVISIIILSLFAYKRRKQKEALIALQQNENDLSNSVDNNVKPKFDPAAEDLHEKVNVSSSPLNL